MHQTEKKSPHDHRNISKNAHVCPAVNLAAADIPPICVSAGRLVTLHTATQADVTALSSSPLRRAAGSTLSFFFNRVPAMLEHALLGRSPAVSFSGSPLSVNNRA